MSATLTTTEKNDLQYNEQIIKKGFKTFVEVGEALARIRDKKLYRETHKTFEDYCKTQWGMSKFYASRIISSSGTVKALPNGNKITSEGQARELKKVPQGQRETVLRQAEKAGGGRVTAKAIREASSTIQEDSKGWELLGEDEETETPKPTPKKLTEKDMVFNEGETLFYRAKMIMGQISKYDTEREWALKAMIRYCEQRLKEGK